MKEAQRIYRSIFGGPIPPRLAQQFAAAPDHVFPPLTAQMCSGYERILAEVRDLESLEFASRLRGRNLLLTLKFQLMVHLAECHPEGRRWYVNRRDRSALVCALRFALAGLRCVYKLCKGSYLLRRYDGP